MGYVLLMTLASVLVDTVDPHAANQVYLCTVAFYHWWAWAYILVCMMLKIRMLDEISKDCIANCNMSEFEQ